MVQGNVYVICEVIKISKIHMKLSRVDSPIKFIPVLRKHTGLGIADLTNRLLNEQSIITFNSHNNDESEVANHIITAVQELGGTIKLFDEDSGEDLSIEQFLNIQESNAETSKYLQDLTDIEISKIFVVIPHGSPPILSDSDGYTSVHEDKDHTVLEYEFNHSLMRLLQSIIDLQVCSRVYQVESDQNSYNDEDEVSPLKLLDNYNRYFE